MKTFNLVAFFVFSSLTPVFAQSKFKVSCNNDFEKIVLSVDSQVRNQMYLEFFNQGGLGENNLESSYVSNNILNTFSLRTTQNGATSAVAIFISSNLSLFIDINSTSDKNAATLFVNGKATDRYSNCSLTKPH